MVHTYWIPEWFIKEFPSHFLLAVLSVERKQYHFLLTKQCFFSKYKIISLFSIFCKTQSPFPILCYFASLVELDIIIFQCLPSLKKNFSGRTFNFHTHFTVDCVLLNKKREILEWIDLMNEDVRWNNNWLSFDKKRCHVAQGPIWSIHTFGTREDSSGVPPSPKRWLCTFFSTFFFEPWRILIISNIHNVCYSNSLMKDSSLLSIRI